MTVWIGFPPQNETPFKSAGNDRSVPLVHPRIFYLCILLDEAGMSTDG